MQKKFSVVAVLMLLSQLFLNTFGAVVSATTVDSDDAILSRDIRYLTNDGEIISDLTNYSGDVTVEIDWSLEGKEIVESTQEQIQLYTAIVYDPVSNQNLTTADNRVVGSYSINETGSLVVTFNTDIVTDQDSSGTITISGKIPEIILDNQEETQLIENNEETIEKDKENEEENEIFNNVIEGDKSNIAGYSEVQLDIQADGDTLINSNLLSEFELIINPGQTTELNITNQEDVVTINVAQINAVYMRFGLVIPDYLEIVPGSTYAMDVPEIFAGFTETPESIFVEGVEVATYIIKDGQIIITFTQGSNAFDDGKLDVKVSGALDASLFEEENEIDLDVPYQDGTSFTIKVKPEKEAYQAQDKKEAGRPYVKGDSGEKTETNRNPEFVEWTVIANDGRESYTNAKVIDDLGPNMKLVEGSVVVKKIIRNYKHEFLRYETVAIDPIDYGNGFQINLGDIEDAYEISYTTELIRPEGGGELTITNKANIELSGESKDYTDDIKVSWSGDIPSITKTGSVSNTNADIINWSVEYNLNKESLGTVDLIDTLSEGIVDLTTIKVYEVSADIDGKIDPNSKNEIQLVTKPYIEDGKVIIPEIDAQGKAYLIEFDSKVPLGLNETITNKIEDTVGNNDEDDVTVNTVPESYKDGSNKIDEDGNPYIEWTININTKLVDVKTINIKDVFNSSHLTFDSNNQTHFSLYKNGSQTAMTEGFSVEDYTHEDGRKGFHLKITDAGPNNYTFVYRTYYTDLGLQQEEVANQAEFVYDNGIVGPTIDVSRAVQQVGINKSGNYVFNPDSGLQEIEWTITFNKNNVLLKNPSIKDTFTSKNYTYIEGSMKILENNKETTDYTPTFNTEWDGFVVSIPKETTATYVIKYRTKADDTNNTKQVNDVILDWQGRDEAAQGTVDKRVSGSEKDGEVIINSDGTKVINWDIDFNTNSNVIHKFSLSDTPSTPIVGDIKIFKNDGTDVTDQFTYTSLENGGFNYTKDRLDAHPYVLKYTTELEPKDEKNDILNIANITYTGGTENLQKPINKPELQVTKSADQIVKEGKVDFIEWTILANKDSDNKYVNLVNAVLRDEIPLDQELVAESIKVFRHVGNELEEVSGLKITTDKNEFKIELPDGPYQYTVKLKTKILEYPSVNEKLGVYTNKTILNNQTKVTELFDTANASAEIDYFKSTNTTNASGKSAIINDDTENVDWTLTLNPLGLTVHNTKIMDTLKGEQKYIRESIKLFNLEQNDPNDSTKPLEIDSKLYTLTWNEATNERGEQFEITFLDGGKIDYPVQVTYSTRLNENVIGPRELTNSAVLYGGSEQREIDKVDKVFTATQWYYGGGGSGRTITFNLNKKHVDGEVDIPGTTFEFIRVTPSGTEIPLNNKVTTNEDGMFVLQNVRSGRYKVIETAAEPYQGIASFYIILGYSSPKEIEDGAQPYKITVTNKDWIPITNNFVSAEGHTLTILNEVKKENVVATKQWGGPSKSSYPQVWFELYRHTENEAPQLVENSRKQVGTTQSTTRVTWNDMPSYTPDGKKYTYSVKEVDADGNDFNPEGYIKQEDGLVVINKPIEKLPIKVSKELSGRELRVDEFNFILTNENGETFEAKNNAKGEIVFDDYLASLTEEQVKTLQKEEPLTLNFTLKEDKSNLPAGITYDETVHEIEVELGYDAATDSYIATPTPEITTNLIFKNSYKAKDVDTTITASKSLESLALTDKQFNFELVSKESEEVIQTKSNNEAGDISFDLNFDEAGEYDFIVREVNDGKGGITYDSREFNVKITVTDDGNGELKAEVDYINGTIAFANKYSAKPANLTIEGTKKLLYRNLEEDQFTFELRAENDQVVSTTTNDELGQIKFKDIEFDKTGEYRYTINEVNDGRTGYTYSKSVFNVIVKVEDDLQGQLHATAIYEDGPIYFENTYIPAPDSIVLRASKVLEGLILEANKFEFILLDEEKEIIDRQTNDAEGEVVFEELTYTEAGTYTYYIKESDLGQKGITYDSSEKKVTVIVNDNDGILEASVHYAAGPAVFTNSYTPAPDSVVIEAEKILYGQQLRNKQFTFELLDKEGTVLQTMNNENGQVIFDEITYTQAGEYDYTIRELEGSQGGMTYDKTEFDVKVIVTDNLEGNLIAEVHYPEEGVLFQNNYVPKPGTVVIEATKLLENKALTKGRFEFNLLDESKNIIQTVSNNAQGQVIFAPITYSQEGEFTYYISEVNDGQATITYDSNLITVTVNVKDNGEGNYVTVVDYSMDGEFKNSYQPLEAVLPVKASKQLVKRELIESEFTFEIVDSSGKVYATASNDEKGDIDFNLVFTEVGTYELYIQEVVGTDSDIIYDDSRFDLVVEVTDVDEQLIATTLYNGEASFSNTFDPPRVSVGDYVWMDINKDGLQDDDEDPIPGVVLEIVDENGDKVTDIYGNPVGPTTTDDKGNYIFENLPIDKTYTVRINQELSAEKLKGLVPTKSEAGNDHSKDSSNWEATSEFMGKDGQHDPTLDFGFIRPSVSVGDYVWIDVDRDGLQDPETDIKLAGVVLNIEDEEGNPVYDIYGDLVGPTTTDENGKYIFENLPIGKTYKVIINKEASKEALHGYEPTKAEVGNDPSKDSSSWVAVSRLLTEDGEHDPTLDFGFKAIEKTYAVGDYTWIDANKDGIQDPNEAILQGVTVELYDGEGNLIASTTTDSNGFYIFDELPAGDYQIKFILTEEQAALYEFTKADAGSDSEDSDANPETGFTIIFTLGDDNKALTKDYDRDVLATEGIDPTWDAGVILKTSVTPIPEEPKLPVSPPTQPELEEIPEAETKDPAPQTPTPDTEDNDQKDDILPYGGRESTMMNYLVGAIMVAAGLTILFSEKRKNGQSK